MLIIERRAGHMAVGRALIVHVDGGRVGALRQHERVLVERDAGVHTVQAELDGGASEMITVRLSRTHDTRVAVTVYPKLSLRNIMRRHSDAYRFDVTPPSDCM